MATILEPPPTAEEIMRRAAQWVARLYGVRVEVRIADGVGNDCTIVVDRAAAERMIQGAPLSEYSLEDRVFYAWWYGHMKNDQMQPPLRNLWQSQARYIWRAAIDAARKGSDTGWTPESHLGAVSDPQPYPPVKPARKGSA